MPRRLPERTENATKKPTGFGSHIRFLPNAEFLQSKPATENQEVFTHDGGGSGDSVAKIQGYLLFVPRSNMREFIRARIRSLSDGLALAERIA